MKIAVVLFSDDFRIKENPALFNAFLQGFTIIPLFVYNENYLGRKLGEASKVFLHHTLNSFNKEIDGNLLIKQGDVIDVLSEIQKEIGFEKIFFNRSYTKKQMEVESEIAKIFPSESYKAKLIFEPLEIREIKVFTYFWKECLANVSKVLKPMGDFKPTFKKINGLGVKDLNLLPNKKWHESIIQGWEFDYSKIEENVKQFFHKKASLYGENRNDLWKDGTSKFAPYIRFGIIAPNVLFWKALEISSVFTSELGWREFAFHTLFRNQNLYEKELKPEFSHFKWESEDFLNYWQKGMTGEEIVDAGMMELWKTGFMHNRTRMMTASFLIKDLMIDWKKGEQWFWDCLFDACPAVNPFSWQWVFGSGYDASPYFRIFNPKLQQEKFDPERIYIKKWLKKAYFPIVEHEIQRKKCLDKFAEIKK